MKKTLSSKSIRLVITAGLLGGLLSLLYFRIEHTKASHESQQMEASVGDLNDGSNPSAIRMSKNHIPRDSKSRELIATLGNRSSQNTASVPPKYRFAGISEVKTAKNFSDWLMLFPPNDRALIKSFADRYPGAYKISSPKEIAWMARRGYPLPEDLIAAHAMSDADLRGLADQGNEKAGFLLYDRILSRVKGPLDKIDNSTPEGARADEAMAKEVVLLSKSKSPFKGYVEAANALRLSDDAQARVGLISGLIRAASLGDSRAADVLEGYVTDGIISDQDFAVAAKIFVDASVDRRNILRHDCNADNSYSPIPLKK